MGRAHRDGPSPQATSINGEESQSQKTEASKKFDKLEEVRRLTNRQVNTTVGEFPEPSFIDGLKSLKLSDVTQVHKKPCVRESLMTGIGGGFAIGGLRAILGARIPVACNWAVGSFVAGSVLMHEYCQRARRMEKSNMKRIVETVQRKNTEEKLRAQDAKDERGAKE